MTTNVSFEDLQELCKKYQNDEKYVYKACNNGAPIYRLRREWLVVMEKCSDTVTNENRKNVVDEKHAKFRADELKVIDIINIKDAQRCTSITNSSGYGDPLLYEVGKIVKCHEFDKNINKVCSGGIHYFKTLFAAYCYYNGPEPANKNIGPCKRIEWHDNGSLRAETNYFDGIKEGPWKIWSLNGSLSSEGSYKDGLKHGKSYVYYLVDGNKRRELNYDMGDLDGGYTEWYDNGQKSVEGNYKKGKRDGTWTEWRRSGQKSIESTYENGKNISWTTWDRNGFLCYDSTEKGTCCTYT